MKEQGYDRVRVNTADSVNRQIDVEASERIEEFGGKSAEEITRRIEVLDKEWDVERVLETNASALAFSGLVLGITVSKKWLAVPGVVLPFLFQHAIQGWCPPLPILRRLGIRTRKEIDREKYALKALRGDFATVDSASEPARPEKAMQAAG